MKNVNDRRVLIVIPTLGDRPNLLEKTFESLNIQRPAILDVVIVCPKQATHARKLAAKFGAIVADDPGGLSAALNVGFKLLKPWHEYACWMGDDDLLTPGSLAATVTAMDANPDVVIAFGYCDYIDDNGKLIFTSRAGKLAPWIMRWGPNLVPLPGMMHRVTAMLEAGEFNTSLKYAMDLDMLLRMRKLGRFINVQKPIGAFRWHSSSTTVANRSASLAEAKQIKHSYQSRYARALAPLWDLPVDLATQMAAKRVTNKALKLS